MNSLLAKLSTAVTVRRKSTHIPSGTATRLVTRLFEAETPVALARAFEALGMSNEITSALSASDKASFQVFQAFKDDNKEDMLSALSEVMFESEGGAKAAADMFEQLQRIKKFAVAIASARRNGDEKAREKLLAKFKKGENIA